MIDTQTQTKKTTLATSLGPNPTVEKTIPDDVVWIDDAFYIKETRFGMHVSVLKDPLGTHFLTGMRAEDVTEMTRWHLKCLQEGTLDEHSRIVSDGIVGGKL
jgi:hypothetical protein|tara:strand:+ start:829 stop:1134 length:306 start_codon:yes stop_codon:yes gene_type:complete